MSREKLKQARKDKGITQQAMADYLNIHISYYKKLEKGIQVGNIELWDRMEDLFNIHQRELRQVFHHSSSSPNDLTNSP